MHYLQAQLVKPLTSLTHFESRAKEGVKLAIRLSGGSNATTYHWINTTSMLLPGSAIIEIDADIEPAILTENIFALNPEQVTLGDILAGDNGEADEDQNNEESKKVADVQIILEALEIDICKDLDFDKFPILSYNETAIAAGLTTRKVREPQDRFRQLVFKARDITMLSSLSAPLNDTCVNSCTALLNSEFLLPHAQ
ncbi:hypothetical protein SERLADRAFT_444065 [Serpula lacrymans var. lacrymans S7.9]|uniref:Uncharacterized protein n=1 Tax=Serpula lacrymans var. lacrymans (strain S7.9) TaxID=578457 RepID=F8PEE3_SERL9|nr:uncharacterized protein SERLADRAFT_444065 [Serpula lacrymans var. lacrymans S7.9]EGO18475.1 hypothetical protein SERLADRAFT_444065 [Serpula lacrymans var. lacrymans S7.9]